MTAAEHLAKAEKYIAAAVEDASEDFPAGEQNCLLYGILHVLCSIAIEMGVPPTTTAAAASA